MSPVHVIVGEDQRAEAMWREAFAGAVDLYRFDRNVDAFERLTAAQAPVDLLVLTPAQRGPFNLTPDQLVARLLEGPLGSGRFLGKLHIIVVGEPLTRSHPRVMAVSTLDAAIRLVKFGEVERAPRPEAPELPVAIPRPAPASGVDIDAIVRGSALSDSVISRIWDAPRSEPLATEAPARPQASDRRPDVAGGGAVIGNARRAPAAMAPAAVAPATPQLFSHPAAPGFVVAAPPMDARAAVVGGGAVAQVGSPGEAIEVSTGALQSSRPYELPNGAGYRGPDLRHGHVHGAIHGGGQPVPPQLASQVQHMVYGNPGSVPDPLLVWSSSSRDQVVPGSDPVLAPTASQPVHSATMPAAVRTVPMEPPAGAYGGGVPAALSNDPFLRRAEQGGGDVSFG